jgi:hypothetical protein
MINRTPPNFALSVGDLDITELVTQFSLRQAQVDVRSPIVWEGSISIARTKLWDGESLDDFVNPSRWARGKHPLTLTINGTLLATLRIASYAFNEDTESAEIQVTQLLKLLDYRTPPEDYRFISTSNRNVSVGFAVRQLLTLGGISNPDLSGYDGNHPLPAPDRTSRGYIELAQEILGERGYWLYHAPNETVKVTKIDFNKIKSFERSRRQLVEFNRLTQNDIVPNIYRVVGGGEKYQTECSLADAINEVEEIYGDRTAKSGYWYRGVYYPLLTITTREVVERIVTEVLKDTPSLIQTKKTGYKNLSLVSESGKEYRFRLRKIYEIIDTRYFDSQGRLVKQIQRKDGIAYGNYPDTVYDLYPLALKWIERLEETITEYSSDPSSTQLYSGYRSFRSYDRNVLRLKTETVNKAFLYTYRLTVGTGVTSIYQIFTAPKERTIETWTEKCPGNEESAFLYRRKVYGRDSAYNYASGTPSLIRTTDLSLISELSLEEDNATPPGWITRPALFPRINAKLNAEVRRSYPGSDDDLIDKREFEYSARSIITNAEARKLAGIFAELNVGRAFGYEVVQSLRESVEFIADPTPLQIAWFHNRVMLLDSVSLVYSADAKAGELTWEGITLKTLSPAVGQGTPSVFAIGTNTTPFQLQTNIRTSFNVSAFNASDAPDVDLISVDLNGNVVTLNGYVQASASQNQFAHILVSSAGSVLVSSNGNVLTSSKDPYQPEVWDAIATMDGEVLTLDGKVLTV